LERDQRLRVTGDGNTPLDRFTLLWLSVLHRALDDACGQTLVNPTDSTRQQQHMEFQLRAREWFRTAGQDFRDLCALVDIPWETVRAAALKAMEKSDDEHSR